jgi:hypothetical protein
LLNNLTEDNIWTADYGPCLFANELILDQSECVKCEEYHPEKFFTEADALTVDPKQQNNEHTLHSDDHILSIDTEWNALVDTIRTCMNVHE